MLNKWIIRIAVVLYIITFALNMGVVIHKDRSGLFEVLPEYMEYREHYYPYEHDFRYRAYQKRFSYFIDLLDDDGKVTHSYELSRRQYAWVTSFIEDNNNNLGDGHSSNHDTKFTITYKYPFKDEEVFTFVQHDTIGWATWILDLKAENRDIDLERTVIEIMEKYNARSGGSYMLSGPSTRISDLDSSRVLFYRKSHYSDLDHLEKPMMPREVVGIEIANEIGLDLQENMWLTYCGGFEKNLLVEMFGYEHGLNGTDISHSKTVVLDTDVLIVYCVPAKHEYRRIVLSSVDPLVRKQLIRDIKIALMTNGKVKGLPGNYLLTHTLVICFSETFLLALVLILFSLKHKKQDAIIERKQPGAKTNESQRENASQPSV